MQTSVSGQFPRSADILSEDANPSDQVFDQDSEPRNSSMQSSSYTALSDQELHSMLNERGPVKRATVELDDIVTAQRGRTMGSLRSVVSLMEIEKLEERRHWKEVSTFLANEPPPSNFVAIPEYGVPENSPKKSLLKIFRRNTKKKSTPVPSRNLQLPDSAVASRTTKGHCHIAISIPPPVTSSYSKDGVAASEHIEAGGLEHQDFATAPNHKMLLDHQESPLLQSESTSAQKTSVSNEKQLPGNHRQPRKNNNSNSSSVLGAETTSALENYYRTELMLEDEIFSVQPKDRAFHSEAMDPKNAVVTGYPSNLDRNNSQWTDSRRSGTTAYSEKTLESLRGHSRGPSSISTAPSTDLHQHWPNDGPPKRTSSKHKTGRNASIELSAPTPAPKFKQAWKQKAGENLIRSSVLSAKSIESDLSSKVAKIADTYSHGQKSVVSSVHNAPISPAPTRPLPDLPEGSHDSRSHRSRSRSHNNDIQQTTGDSGNKSKRPTEDCSRQSRQDKVKALRMRDINAVRAINRSTTPKDSQTCICGAPPMANSRTGMNGAPRHSSSLSRETGSASAANTLSPIMLVADSEPYLGFGQSDDFLDSTIPFDPRSSHYFSTYSNYRGRVLTPPRSVEPSLASSDDETLHLPRSRASTSNASRSQAGSVRSRHRFSRSSMNRKSSPQFQEEDITERLQKLDNSIAAILQTMTAVMEMGSTIKELNQVMLPESPLLDLPDPYQTQAHNLMAETTIV